MTKNIKAQSTLEYVIIAGILIGVFIAIGRMLQPKISSTYSKIKSGVSSQIQE